MTRLAQTSGTIDVYCDKICLTSLCTEVWRELLIICCSRVIHL